MKKTIIAIGGGEIKSKETFLVDEFIAAKAKQKAAEAGVERATAVFFGTASHDSMPYFNSFRKTYTSIFDIKAEVALCVYGSVDLQNISEKLNKAQMVYIGGGDTKFMLDTWREKGILPLILDAYNRGVIICGLSAGAVCWFDKMYTDYDIVRGESNEYKILEGLGILHGTCCPHYNLRGEFDSIAGTFDLAYAIEDNAALQFEDGGLVCKTGNGAAYIFNKGQRTLLI